MRCQHDYVEEIDTFGRQNRQPLHSERGTSPTVAQASASTLMSWYFAHTRGYRSITAKNYD